MLYEIEDKFFIVASGYYREVVVKKDKDNYTVIPVKNGKKIYQNINDNYKKVKVAEAYNKSHKEKSRFSNEEK